MIKPVFTKIVLAAFTLSIIPAVYSQKDNTTIQVSAKQVWQSEGNLTTSESVCYDPVNNIIYVSCIDGNPVEKDGNGFISRLSLTGEIVDLKWITGLNAPKGMVIKNGNLYVTDIDRITEINIVSSNITKYYFAEGAKFLNDVTVSPNGDLYFTDTSTGIIYRIVKDLAEIWLDDDQIINPNGLFYESGELLVGTKNRIYSIRLTDKRIWSLKGETGNIDGLKADGHGNYIISDWSGKVQLVNSEGILSVLLNTTDTGVNAADFEFIPTKNLLIIPTFNDNRVIAYEVSFP